jgi:mRNA interferase RelE/StbE
VNVEYLPSFLKDLKRLKSTPVFAAIQTFVFDELPGHEDFNEIRNLKLLAGTANTYRIRVGDYRIGLIASDNTITLMRVLHRKEIYRYFP